MSVKQSRPGRPSKLTPETKARLLEAIRRGNYYEVACSYAGISYSIFRKWLIQGEQDGEGPYFELLQDVKRAEHEAEMALVEQWRRAMPEDWKAIATFLERRHPDRWGKRDRLGVDHSGRQEIVIRWADDVEDGHEGN